jgi:acyl carrier protein
LPCDTMNESWTTPKRTAFTQMSLGDARLNDNQCERVLGDFFREFFDDEKIVLRPDMMARDVDGWDSLAHVRLLLTIERKFKIKFSASEVGSLQTIGDLVGLIGRKTDSNRI